MNDLTWRDRAVARLARHVMRPMLALPIPWKMHRAGADMMGPRYRAKPGLTLRRAPIAGVPCLTICPPQPDGTLLWLHGGGFVLGSSRMYEGFGKMLAERANMRVVLPDYRLAPEHPFPAAPDDCLAVARALLADGPLSLGGDSAGGTLALTTCADLLAEGKAPHRMVLISPATDLDPTRDAPPESDEMLLAESMLHRCVADYLAGADPRDPRASPIHADFTGAPPTLLQLAVREVLEQDGHAIAARLKDAGARVRVQRFDGMPHDFQIFVGLSPMADRAIARITGFLKAAP